MKQKNFTFSPELLKITITYLQGGICITHCILIYALYYLFVIYLYFFILIQNLQIYYMYSITV